MPPIYGYECKTSVEVIPEGSQLPVSRRPCGHKFEVLYKSPSAVQLEEASEACPACGGTDKVRDTVNKTSHVLKGSGWFKDGY